MAYTHKIYVPNSRLESYNRVEYEVFFVTKCSEMSHVMSHIDVLDDLCPDLKGLM